MTVVRPASVGPRPRRSAGRLSLGRALSPSATPAAASCVVALRCRPCPAAPWAGVPALSHCGRGPWAIVPPSRHRSRHGCSTTRRPPSHPCRPHVLPAPGVAAPSPRTGCCLTVPPRNTHRRTARRPVLPATAPPRPRRQASRARPERPGSCALSCVPVPSDASSRPCPSARAATERVPALRGPGCRPRRSSPRCSSPPRAASPGRGVSRRALGDRSTRAARAGAPARTIPGRYRGPSAPHELIHAPTPRDGTVGVRDDPMPRARAVRRANLGRIGDRDRSDAVRGERGDGITVRPGRSAETTASRLAPQRRGLDVAAAAGEDDASPGVSSSWTTDLVRRAPH